MSSFYIVPFCAIFITSLISSISCSDDGFVYRGRKYESTCDTVSNSIGNAVCSYLDKFLIMSPIQLRPQCGRNWINPIDCLIRSKLSYSKTTSKLRFKPLGKSLDLARVLIRYAPYSASPFSCLFINAQVSVNPDLSC